MSAKTAVSIDLLGDQALLLYFRPPVDCHFVNQLGHSIFQSTLASAIRRFSEALYESAMHGRNLIAYCLFGAIADKSKLLKDGADEPNTQISRCQAGEASDSASGRLRLHAAGSPVMWNSRASSSSGSPELASRFQWSLKPG